MNRPATLAICAGAALACMTAAAWGEGARTRPARSGGLLLPPAPKKIPSSDNLRQDLAAISEALGPDLRGDEARAKAAQDKLLTLQKAYLDALGRHADDDDLEVRQRVRLVMDKVLANIRIRRILVVLPESQARRLRKYQAARPEQFARLFSPDLEESVAAVREIAKTEDPHTLAEPMIVLCLKHPSRDLVSAACEAAATGRYRSDAVVDALCHVLATADNDDWQRRYSYAVTHGGGQGPAEPPAAAALRAIHILRPKRAATALLAMVRDGRRHDLRRTAMLAEALAATGEVRAVPALLEEIHRSGASYSYGDGNRTVEIEIGDIPLLAAIRLTGQSPGRYGFVQAPSEYDPSVGSLHGFLSDKDRRKAKQDFEKWWKEHQNQPPYRGMKPLEPKQP